MNSDVVITSSSNPSIKRLRALMTRRRMRYRERMFAAEGKRVVETLLAHGSEPVELFLAESADPTTRRQLTEASQSEIPKWTQVSDTLLKQSLETVTPQPVAAVFKMNPRQLSEDPGFVLVLDGVRDPGNLGTVVRAATAAGIEGIATLPGAVDPYNPKVVRGSAGLIESLPVFQVTTLAEVLRRFSVKPSVVVADAGGSIHYSDVDWTASTVLVVGGEASGVTSAPSIDVDFAVSIPMRNGVESLNVAASTAVLLFEADRQRRLNQGC